MPNHVMDVDILIVGAGPVGLFMANECARRGLRFRIIESRSGQSVHSKALAIFPRTLEIFDMAGLVEPFLDAANRVTSLAMVVKGRTLARVPFEPKESPYPFIAMVPQDVTEQILARELSRKGGAVEFDTKFVSARQHPDGVEVTIERAGEEQTQRARFLVGCDGAHSAVRHMLGLPFAGSAYADNFMLADVDMTTTLGADQMQLCPGEHGPVAIFPMGARRRRIVAIVDRAEGNEPSLDFVRELLKHRGPGDLEVNTLHWGSFFRIHRRRVAQLRVGRTFLAGDAAHIHSPFGGQGMNTGLQDVWNLAWKLDLFLRGAGNERLLDSYNDERLPVVEKVIKVTDFLTKAMSAPSKVIQALRNFMIPKVSRLSVFRHDFVQILSELAVAYGGSPIIEGPGKRYFDESLRSGEGIGRSFRLLIGTESRASIAEPLRQFGEQFGGIVEVRPWSKSGLMLIRPDGYIAYSSKRVEQASLDALRMLLDRQTVDSITRQDVATGDNSVPVRLITDR